MHYLTSITNEMHLSTAPEASKALYNMNYIERVSSELVGTLKPHVHLMSKLRSNEHNYFIKSQFKQQILYVACNVTVGEFDTILGGYPFLITPVFAEYQMSGGRLTPMFMHIYDKELRQLFESKCRFSINYGDVDYNELCTKIIYELYNELIALRLINSYTEILLDFPESVNVNDLSFISNNIQTYLVSHVSPNSIDLISEKFAFECESFASKSLAQQLPNRLMNCGEFQPLIIKFSDKDCLAMFKQNESHKRIQLVGFKNSIDIENTNAMLTGVLEVLYLRSMSFADTITSGQKSDLLKIFSERTVRYMTGIEDVWLSGLNEEIE